MTDTVLPKTQTASPTTAHFQHFSPRWSALWAPHQHEPRPHHHQTRGISLHEGPTRRRHAPYTTKQLGHAVRRSRTGRRYTRVIGHVVLLGLHLAYLGMPFSSARGPAIPSLGNPAHVRNRRPTCETAGSHAGRVGTQVAVAHSQSMTDHGAATHRPAMQHSQERGKHHHLQQQLSHATKPKSHPASNTICPSSKLAHTTYNTNFPHQQPKSHHKTNTFCPVTQKTPPAPVRRLPKSQAAMPVGDGRAWPDNEPTRRAKLAARTARGRAAAHGHTKQPSRDSGRVQSPARAPAATCAAARDTQTHRTLTRTLSPGLVHRRKRPPL